MLTHQMRAQKAHKQSVTESLGYVLPIMQGGTGGVNLLSPDIKMHILLTVLHTFLMELVRRICLNIKSTYPW